jgi:hypothetical protein
MPLLGPTLRANRRPCQLRPGRAAAMRDYWAVFGVLVGWFLAFYLLDLVRYSRLPPPGQPQAGPAKVRACPADQRCLADQHTFCWVQPVCSRPLGALWPAEASALWAVWRWRLLRGGHTECA